jgi:hypothetical protein
MPTFEEMKKFCLKLIDKLGKNFELLNYHERSRAFLIGKKEIKIK